MVFFVYILVYISIQETIGVGLGYCSNAKRGNFMGGNTFLIVSLMIILVFFVIYLAYKLKIEKHNKNSKLEIIAKALQNKEQQCQILFENLSEYVLVIKDGVIIVANPRVMKQSGYEEKLVGMKLESIIVEEDIEKTIIFINSFVLYDKNEHKFQFRVKSSNGGKIWVEATALNVEWNEKKGVMLLLVDINKSRLTEEKLSYICYHDQLTGLYNRRFFEEELSRVDTPRNFPIGIMMIDVNGLKLINDAFGHMSGDSLIKIVSKLISEELRSDDIIARIGGDEFCIILPSITELDLISLKSRLRESTKTKFIQDIPVSIAIGYALKYDAKIDISQVLNSSDVMMYQDKLSEKAKLRKEAIAIILSNLEKRYPNEKEHAKGTSEICKQIGKQLGFTQNQLLEILILGYYHDIGKIALQENILNEKGELDSNQWDNLKRHPETGYSILSSSNEFAGIAESVLSHHERWDGNGYPKGLKGEKIPLYARVVAVAEVYDSLIRDQPYRPAIKPEEALEIIRENSGTQFDPDIVKALIRVMI